MPKKNKKDYPALSHKHVEKILKRAGFAFEGCTGGHAYYTKGSFTVTVPRHSKDSLAPKTLKSIIIQSGMPKDQFYSYLGMVTLFFGTIFDKASYVIDNFIGPFINVLGR